MRESNLIPTEPYGTSKICADVITQSFIETYGMDSVIITRCCNVYGFDWNNRIIPNTIRACLKSQDPIIFMNDPSTRQYIYINDVLKTFYELMNADRGGVVLIATHDVKNQKEVVLEILKHFPHLKPRYVKKHKIKEITHQSMIPDLPKVYIPFEEGIKLTIEQFKKYGV